MNKTIITVLAVVVLATGGYFVWKALYPSGYSQSSPTNNQNSNQETKSAPEKNTVTIADTAFSPQELKIKVSDTVTWKNEDTAIHKIASDPHPTHTDLPELVSGNLAKGQNYSFTFDKKGTFGYHCHLHVNMKGTIIVE